MAVVVELVVWAAMEPKSLVVVLAVMMVVLAQVSIEAAIQMESEVVM